ncbi:hypothetical protein IC229_34110 [Spirosoma sp. BT702]|uniref:Uncharacterized protein n=1 Tax=Spirosoma profusum TaxID=2771354 RepID=A0A927AWD6_9BACT|nr:hypothetical protein [Spirosoma profusum]
MAGNDFFIADTRNHRIRKVSCGPLVSLKAGSWSDPTVWYCNRVPLSTDVVRLNHAVSLPANYQVQALRVIYSATGRLNFDPNSKLVFIQP